MARPTITIDTSAVSSSADPSQQGSDAVPLQPIQPIPNTQSAIQGDSEAGSSEWASSTVAPTSGASHRSQASKGSIPELRAAESFESRDSRPTSPHNFSSPVSRLGPTQGFLSVPGTRSRQNSVDSDEASRSSGTYVGDASALSGAKSDGDRKEPAAVGSNKDIMQDREALKPDPGTEADFFVDDNKFAFTPGILNKLINPKSLSAFYAVGGLAGLEKGLRTDRNAGLSVDETTLDGKVSFESVVPDASRLDLPTKPPLDKTTTTGAHREKDGGFADRRRIFKDNRLPEKKGKSLLQLMWITYNDKVLILLSIAALVSLGVGLYQTFGMTHPEGQPAVEWIEGVAIIVAIVIVVLVGSLNDYQKERQFVKLNKKKQDRIVNVIRSGKSQEISVFDILVGDVMLLHAGDMVPCDGIFIEGHSLKCDESSATGESDLMRKTPADDVYAAIENGEEVRKLDPFILSGAQVTEGVGTFVVTSVGVNSSHGKIMMSLREDQEATPLQSKLNILAEYIAKLGGAAGLLLFVVLFIKFLVGLKGSDLSPAEKGQQFLGIFIVTVTIIVVAVPEGLPLAVTLALAFATTRMLKDNNLVRHLRACEVMGNATAICSDKTGTLTQNKMLVVAGAVGTSSRFSGHADGMEGQETSQPATSGAVDDVGAQEAVKSLDQEVKDLLIQSIAINSTAFEGEVDNQASFIGSKTETALLTFARTFLAMGPVGELRSNVKTVQVVPFDSKRKCSGVVMVLENGKYRLIVKGASEIMLENCTEVISDPTRGVSGVAMSSEQRQMLSDLITSYAERSLRTIGLVYRDFESWPPQQARRAEGAPHEALFDDVFKNMTLLTIVGIQDPLRPGVREAVETCQKAGVTVRMVTGDNVITARAIAKDCGIYTGGEVIEGPAFRKLTTKEKDRIIPRLQVLARSSPEDKRILVKRLKELGETVAVTGDGTNDAPALKGADVGFSMGIAGTEVAKEASAIILMDDNFASIVKAMMWGRAVNDAVKKFLQFQVTVNITAVLLTFITATSSSSESSILTAVQLLWVNLIMDTLAALALATDPPTPSILNRKPELKTAPLISITMWKMIIGEAIYQLAVTLFLYYAAANVWAYEPYEVNNLQTFVFNTFVWMQIFNQWK
jgi:Ca2+-transporting ATPase